MKLLFCFFLILMVPIYAFSGDEWNWSHPVPPSNVLHTVHVFDSLNIIAMGDAGIMLFTNDFGRTWDPHYVENITQNIYGSHFFDRLRGLIVGENGLIAITNDGGQSWMALKQSVKHFTRCTLKSIKGHI